MQSYLLLQNSLILRKRFEDPRVFESTKNIFFPILPFFDKYKIIGATAPLVYNTKSSGADGFVL